MHSRNTTNNKKERTNHFQHIQPSQHEPVTSLQHLASVKIPLDILDHLNTRRKTKRSG